MCLVPTPTHPVFGFGHLLRAALFALVWTGCTAVGLPEGPNADKAAITSGEKTEMATGVPLHGANLVGMEGTFAFDAKAGPIPDVEYAVHSTSIIDYLASRDVNVLRFVFSWERMQAALGGPIPAASSGNYKTYFDDYMRIVDYATNVKSMTVIVTPWQTTAEGGSAGGARWRGEVVGGTTVTNAHFADFWSKMATIFKGRPRVALGLITEPNQVDTMAWFGSAQVAISAIRKTGFDGDIYVPGNGWTAAGTWEDDWYDAASPKHSNAYGWLNARGVGKPLSDPLKKLVVEVHTYADDEAGGSSATVVSKTITRQRISKLVTWAKTNHLKVFIGEIGMYAQAPNASANWLDFAQYLNENADTVIGYAWWACGKPGWWDDVAANGGGHFSLTPTGDYKVDTVNMKLFLNGLRAAAVPSVDEEAKDTSASSSSPSAAADEPSDSPKPKVESEPAKDDDDKDSDGGSSSTKQSRAAAEESSPKSQPKIAASGCSTGPRGGSTDGLLIVASTIAASVVARRRRR